MKTRSAILLVVLAVCVFFPSSVRCDFEESNWQFLKEAGAPEAIKSNYAFFQIDAEIYDGDSDGLQSLRIVDSDLREIPYEIVTKPESEHKQEFFPKILNNSYIAGEYNSFELDTGEERPAVNELTLLTNSRNFTRSASVEGSNNQLEWNVLVKEAYIFDFSRNVESKHLRIEFPSSNFRFLRVKVFDDGNGPLEINGARLFRARKEEAQIEQWPLAVVGRTENQEKKTSEIILDAGHVALPLREINLDIKDRNYHRNVEIASSMDRKHWNLLGTGVIYNYDLPAFRKTGSSLTFLENRDGRYLKLVVHNYDDQPLGIERAVGKGLVRRVILSTAGRQPYRVYFGNDNAHPPVYDLAHRIPYIETDRLPRLTLSARKSNPTYIEPKQVRPWSEEHAWLLWAAMGASIFVLGFLIFNLMRKTLPVKQRE